MRLSASVVCQLHVCKAYINALKFWWDQEMGDLKMKSVTSFRAWQAVGKPRAGVIHDEMLINKMTYRKAIKDKDRLNMFEISKPIYTIV